MLLEKVSPSELVFEVRTRGGQVFEVVLDIQYDNCHGHYYNSAYYLPGSVEKLKKSQCPLQLQIELSQAVDALYRAYMENNKDEVTAYLLTEAV